MSSQQRQATVAGCLQVGDGFPLSERAGVIDRLSSLDDHLAPYGADETVLDLSVKDRERPGQKMTLECRIAGRTHVVATSSAEQIAPALVEVRDELRRQLEDARSHDRADRSAERR